MLVTILLVDDHAIVRQGLRALLESQSDLLVVGEAENGIEAVQKVQALAPQVTILDILMPGGNGLEAAKQIHDLTRVIMLSMYKDESYVAAALQNGAMGFVLKDSSSTDLVEAIHAVMNGDKYICQPFSLEKLQQYEQRSLNTIIPSIDDLTKREKEVLQLVAAGKSNIEVAQLLKISPRTVEIHRAHVYEKLDVHSEAELTRFAIQQGIIRI